MKRILCVVLSLAFAETASSQTFDHPSTKAYCSEPLTVLFVIPGNQTWGASRINEFANAIFLRAPDLEPELQGQIDLSYDDRASISDSADNVGRQFGDHFLRLRQQFPSEYSNMQFVIFSHCQGAIIANALIKRAYTNGSALSELFSEKYRGALSFEGPYAGGWAVGGLQALWWWFDFLNISCITHPVACDLAAGSELLQRSLSPGPKERLVFRSNSKGGFLYHSNPGREFGTYDHTPSKDAGFGPDAEWDDNYWPANELHWENRKNAEVGRLLHAEMKHILDHSRAASDICLPTPTPTITPTPRISPTATPTPASGGAQTSGTPIVIPAELLVD